MKKAIFTAVLIAGSFLSVSTAHAQSGVSVKRGDVNSTYQAQSGYQFHLTVGNGNPKTDVTFYSNSYSTLFGMYQFFMLFAH